MTFNFDDVKDTGLNLNEFLSLLNLYLNKFKEDTIEFDARTKDLIILQKKGYIKIIDFSNISVRGSGKEMIEKVMNFEKVSTKNNSPMSTLFEEFWKLFPTTDKHSIYVKSRTLKSNRIGCKKKYISYLKEGIKHEDIIKALRYEIEDRKKTSGKDNKLSFMKNSNTWLNQREFDIILESMPKNGESSDDNWTSNVI